MKSSAFGFGLLVVWLLLVGSSGSEDGSSSSEIFSYSTAYEGVSRSSNHRSTRALLSVTKKDDAAVMAVPDGTVYLVDRYTGQLLWSFKSGPSIYTSYQAPVDEEDVDKNSSGLSRSLFFDCGDDWELYVHNRLLGEKMRLKLTMEDVIKSTPQVLEDGGVMLGSKKTTVFLVDALTGKVFKSYSSSDSQLMTGIGGEANVSFADVKQLESEDIDLVPLYITRRDYSLHAFAPNSGKILWNMTVAEFGATLFCQEGSEYRGSSLITRSDFSNNFNLPLSCHSEATVHRFRGQDILDTLADGLLRNPSGDTSLPVLSSTHLPDLQRKFEELDQPSKALMLPSHAQKLSEQGSEKGPYLAPINGAEDVLPFPPEIMTSVFAGSPTLFLVVLSVICLSGFIGYFIVLVAGENHRLKQQSSNYSAKGMQSKRKRTRKSGKDNSILEQKDASTSQDNDSNRLWLYHKKTEGGSDTRRIGSLSVSNTEIAKGSNGTVIFEGIYQGRAVAVKRMVQAHHDVAFKEIQNLIASDQHPNIVRWYGVEYDQDFVYLSLERCSCSLNDLIQAYSGSLHCLDVSVDQQSKAMANYKLLLDSVRDNMGSIQLRKSNDTPSSLMLKLMRDVVSGLVHLHRLGIIHRDLKPQNVLIIREGFLCAKLSDMGISKRLSGDMSSLGNHATGYGSSGWQAPEQILDGRQTRAVDMFSLGCVLFFCITGGRHPFGERIERDNNIVKNRLDLFLVECIPEAFDLCSRLLDPNPDLRPKAVEALHHPLFWSSERRLSFLRDTSDRIELEDRDANSELLNVLESIAKPSFGGKWDEKLDPVFIADIGRYRRYKFGSVRDLLRVMRNKLSHFRELPQEIQEILGPVPDGFNAYFGSRFPKLLIEVYKVMYRFCRQEECFQKYFNGNSCEI